LVESEYAGFSRATVMKVEQKPIARGLGESAEIKERWTNTNACAKSNEGVPVLKRVSLSKRTHKNQAARN
jgi:hypothetical protein